MIIQIIQSADGQWYFRLVASNGRKLCHSEQYRRIAGAEKAVALLKRDSASATVEVIPRPQRKETPDE